MYHVNVNDFFSSVFIHVTQLFSIDEKKLRSLNRYYGNTVRITWESFRFRVISQTNFNAFLCCCVQLSNCWEYKSEFQISHKPHRDVSCSCLYVCVPLTCKRGTYIKSHAKWLFYRQFTVIRCRHLFLLHFVRFEKKQKKNK